MNYYEAVIDDGDIKEKYLVKSKSIHNAEKKIKKEFQNHEIISLKLTKYVDVL